MNCLLSKRFYTFFIITCAVVGVFYFENSPVAVRAEKPPTAGQSVVFFEENARKTGKIWNENSIRQSLELYRQAAEQWENFKNSQNAARCLREAAKLKLILAEEKSAVPLLEKALRLEQKSGNAAGEADTLSLLTIVSVRNADLEKSRIYHAKALETAEKTRLPDVLARAFFASGQFFYNERDFDAMLKEQEKALKLFREAGDKEGEAEILIELAYSYIINNDRIRGRDSALKAVEISKETGNLRSQTFALIVLGDAHQRMGEWQSAVKYFLEAEKLFPENLDLFEKAVLNNRLGFYNLAYNELNQAKKYFQKSFELYDKIGNSEGRSELLTELGQIAVRQKNYEEAMRCFDQSREIAEKANDPIALGVLDLKIGDTYFERGDYSLAEKYYLNSLDHYKKLGITYRTAEVQERLGLVFEKKNEYQKAREKYLLALGMNRKILSKFAQAQTLFNLARLDNLQNRMESALGNIREAIKLTESSQGETANSQLKRSFFSDVFDRYELYINLLMKARRRFPTENYAIEALQAAEKSRARVILENISLSEANFTTDADAETVKREKEIRVLMNAKADELTDLLSQNVDKSEIEKLDNEIDELDHELEEIKARLKQESPVYSAIKNPTPFDVAEFQKNILDEKSLLLEFSFGEEESYLWLIGKMETGVFVLPARGRIEAKIQTLRELLSAREMIKDESIETYQARIAQADKDYWIAAKELSRDLFGQVADKFAENRLIIVPDGKLKYFPVSALPLPDAESEEPILLSHEVVYEPSASTLFILTNNKNQLPTKDLLVFSDPVFSENDPRILTKEKTEENSNSETILTEKYRFAESLNTLERLEASKKEADSIVNIIGASNTDNFSGFSANRERLFNTQIGNYKIIHFATHGLLNEERPELSGIVLSRFNEQGQKLEEFVRLQDIYGLKLNSDLVVLSACETGIGKEIRGDGLMSLNNAFLQVGAKSVMSSLWKVEDGATLELMKNFYAFMANENITPSKALQKAKIKMRRDERYKSPFYWAAFTVQGNFRHSPKLSSGGWNSNYYFLILLLPIFLYGMWFWRKRAIRKKLNF